jgi:beta-ribofuranosylaminobenzene 5'-phosphate synthase
MTSPCIRIRTPSRLHFGLLAWGAQATRQFGGVGLMIESPTIEVRAAVAPTWIASGPLASRVEQVVGQLQRQASEIGMTLPPCRIEIERAPAEHVGLGVGTQLSLAVARAVLSLARQSEVTALELARLTGRGGRSGIGLHGFEHGGLIVDGGRKRDSDLPPLLARVPFPEDWSILIVQAPGERGLHGPEEKRAFATLPPIAENVTESLCRLVLLELLPAVIERDLPTFGAALSDLQRRVGACFAPAQGGIYMTPQAASIVDELRRLEFAGVGQSSWGPTLYAFCTEPDDEIDARVDRLCRRVGLDGSSIFRTKAANSGASLSIDG